MLQQQNHGICPIKSWHFVEKMEFKQAGVNGYMFNKMDYFRLSVERNGSLSETWYNFAITQVGLIDNQKHIIVELFYLPLGPVV